MHAMQMLRVSYRAAQEMAKIKNIEEGLISIAPRFPSGHFFPLFRSVNHFRDDSLPYKRYTYERKTVNSAEKFR